MVDHNNKKVVLAAVKSLFQERKPLAINDFFSPEYVDHSPGMAQGRRSLAKLVTQLPPTSRYDIGQVIAEDDFVVVHARTQGWAPGPQIVADIFRIEGGQIVEHWDVREDEAVTSAGASNFPQNTRLPAARLRDEVDYDRALKANLSDVFGQRDPARRLAAIRELYHPDAFLHEPHASVSGHQAISDAVTALLGSLPEDTRFTPDGPGVGHNDVGRLKWKAGAPSGPIVATGTDVARFERGRIRSLHVFLDPPGDEAPATGHPPEAGR
jgi:predicted SnoaL-like aldol condensation-catalyzing enzyme